MSFAKPTESSTAKLSPGDSTNNPSSTTCATEEEKRRNRKSRYQQEPRLGYRSGYSVNRSFTQAEIMLLKQILKESGESSSVDQFGPAAAARGVGGAWQQQQQPQQQQQQQQNSSHGAVGGPASSVKDASNADGTVVFPANEQNPKNRELLTQARKKRTRNVTSPYQARVLRKVLQLTSFPSTEMREALAHSLNMHPRTVQIWFQNQRQKAKNNPQVVTNQSVAGVVPHLDGFHSSPSDLVLPMSPPGSANGGGMLFSNMAMLPNNSSAGVNGSMAQAISSQQSLLPGSSYAFMPFYHQSASATSAAPSSSSYSSAYYLPSATLQLPGYPTPTSAYPPTPTSVSQVSPQPGYPSPTATSPTDEFSNPTLDMLAAAALEAEGDPDDQDDDDEDDSSPQQHHVYSAKGANMHHAPAAMCSPDQLRPW